MFTNLYRTSCVLSNVPRPSVFSSVSFSVFACFGQLGANCGENVFAALVFSVGIDQQVSISFPMSL